jgi:hypothetical protein
MRLLYGTHLGTAPVIQATLINMLCFGIIFATAGGIGLGLMTLLETPLDTGPAATPARLLVTNRMTVLRQVLVMAPLLAVVIGVAGWVKPQAKARREPRLHDGLRALVRAFGQGRLLAVMAVHSCAPLSVPKQR